MPPTHRQKPHDAKDQEEKSAYIALPGRAASKLPRPQHPRTHIPHGDDNSLNGSPAVAFLPTKRGHGLSFLVASCHRPYKRFSISVVEFPATAAGRMFCAIMFPPSNVRISNMILPFQHIIHITIYMPKLIDSFELTKIISRYVTITPMHSIMIFYSYYSFNRLSQLL